MKNNNIRIYIYLYVQIFARSITYFEENWDRKEMEAGSREINIKKFDNPEAYYRDWTG